MPAEVERRLAAILSADVVGYSRLMAEPTTATRARALRADCAWFGIEVARPMEMLAILADQQRPEAQP